MKRTHQTCSLCNESKPVELFVADSTRVSKRYPWCKDCVRAYRQERRIVEHVGDGTGGKLCYTCEKDITGTHANRRFCSDSCKDRASRWRAFGLTPTEYRALIEATGGRCPICQRRIRKWQLDHNHETGELTGAVCVQCNVGPLAHSRHDPAFAQRLVDYLTDPPVRSLFGEKRYTGPEQVSQLHRRWLWSGASTQDSTPPVNPAPSVGVSTPETLLGPHSASTRGDQPA